MTAFTPPPYTNITGIAKTLNNYVETCPLSNYQGNARPGDIVVDLSNYTLWVGNTTGQLNQIGGPNSVTPAGIDTCVQFNLGGSFGADTNFTYDYNTGHFTVATGIFSELNTSVVTGDLIPSGNSVYSLGNATNQWKDLWVSNATIYLETIPLSLGSNGQLTFGGANVVTASPTGIASVPNLSVSGNVIAGYLYGDGSNISNISVGAGDYSNANVTAYLPYNLANVAGQYFIGDGSLLTNINAANVLGSYSNANTAAYLQSGLVTTAITTTSSVVGNAISLGTGNLQLFSNVISSVTDPIYIDPLADGTNNGNVVVLGNLQVAGTVTYNDSNITTTDNLVWAAANNAISPGTAAGGGLSVGPAATPYATFTYNPTSNTWVSNIAITANGGANIGGALTGATTGAFSSNVTVGNLSTAGTVTAAQFIGDAGLLSNIPAANIIGAYSNVNVAAYLPVNTANVAGQYFIGNGAFLTGLPAGYSNANVASYLPTYLPTNTSNVGAASVNATGNVSGTYILGNGAYLTGLPAGYSNTDAANYFASGTVTTDIITSSTVTANTLSAGANNIQINSNVISSITNPIVIDPLADGTNNGNVFILGSLSVGGNVTYINSNVTTTDNLVWAAANNAGSTFAATGGGLSVGPANAPYATWLFNATTNSWDSNINVSVAGNVTGNLFAGDGGLLSNINAANIIGGYGDPNVSAYLASGADANDIITTGNIQGTYVLGNGAFLTGLPAGYANSNAASYFASGTNGNDIITTANVTATAVTLGAGNLAISGNLISTTSNTILIDPLGDASPTTGDVVVLGNLSVTGNLTYVDVSTAQTSNLVWVAADTAGSSFAASGGGLVVGPALAPYATWQYDQPNNQWASNIGIGAGGNISSVGSVNAAYFWGDGSNISNVNTSGISNATTSVAIPVASGSIAFTVNGNPAGNIGSGGKTALGLGSGLTGQGAFSTALGHSSGQTNQGAGAVAIGSGAGYSGQGAGAVAIGEASGYNNQGVNAVAIGHNVGNNQGAGSIAIGLGGGNVFANSIILNSSGVVKDTFHGGFYVLPVLADVGNTSVVLNYNNTTSEITSGPAMASYGGIQAAFSGQLTNAHAGSYVQAGNNITLPNVSTVPVGAAYYIMNTAGSSTTPITVSVFDTGNDFIYFPPLWGGRTTAVPLYQGQYMHLVNRGGGEWDVTASNTQSAQKAAAPPTYPVDTGLSLDNLNVKMGTNGMMYLSAVTGSIVIQGVILTMKYGSAATTNNRRDDTLTSGSWTQVTSASLADVGDTNTASIQDTTNSRVYNITIIKGRVTPDQYSICIERLFG